jgi:hypothetical protein
MHMLKSIAVQFTFVGLLLTACAHQPAAPPTPVALKVSNVGPAFLNFWDASEGRPEEERVTLFLDRVVAPYPQLFGASVLNKTALVGPSANPRARDIVASYLKGVKPYVARMREITDSIDRDFDRYAEDFGAAFPDFAPKSPVYFTVSLFAFDGATRTVDGQTVLLFGIDGMARWHPADENLKVLFDHELFHLYHSQIWPEGSRDEVPLWMSLWEEGLATYVSQRMNPGASEGQVLLNADLAERAEPVLPKLVNELLDNFDSLDHQEYAAFFYSSNGRKDIPQRSGYFVGLRIAQSLGATRTLKQLATLHGSELKEAVRRALAQLTPTNG